jgi:hypothetical protein
MNTLHRMKIQQSQLQLEGKCINIQGDSGGVTTTYGAHFLRHFEQKVSYNFSKFQF